MNKRSFIYLAVAILVLLSQGPRYRDGEPGFLGFWMILLAVLALTFSLLGPRLIQKKWPSISDTDFIEELKPVEELPSKALVAERRYVSKVLGVQSTKLRADHQLDDLSKAMDFFGSGSVALGDLQAEIEELYADSARDIPSPPKTVGDLVLQLAKGRAVSSLRDQPVEGQGSAGSGRARPLEEAAKNP